MYSAVDFLVHILKRVVPDSLARPLKPFYHEAVAALSAFFYGFPASRMTIIGVTGTKGKSTTADMLYAVFKDAGVRAALVSTIRFVTPKREEPNRFKMTMPGRGFTQQFLARARQEGATHAIVEITSEGVLNARHRYLFLDGLVVTNIQREHIERHGSFENYVDAKRAIVHALETSSKKKRVLVANADNEYTSAFLGATHVSQKIPFSRHEFEKVHIALPFPGEFNKMNALAALKMAEAFGIERRVALHALSNMPKVLGRVEYIESGQPFTVVVDYAHTPDSLEALYSAFPGSRKICVLGNTGGGRDVWKRPLMGAIADRECDTVILTNEDPYDEDPEKIVREMMPKMKREPAVIMDRREAIRTALRQAKTGDVVLISGKGTDPYIMIAGGKKTPWSDAGAVREELARLGFEGPAPQA